MKDKSSFFTMFVSLCLVAFYAISVMINTPMYGFLVLAAILVTWMISVNLRAFFQPQPIEIPVTSEEVNARSKAYKGRI